MDLSPKCFEQVHRAPWVKNKLYKQETMRDIPKFIIAKKKPKV